jgi:signal transduction histidine kinase
MGSVIADQERKLEESAALSGWKEIASFLSHQLKNPLAAVDLSVSNAMLVLKKALPRGGAQDEPILGEALASIQEETARMKALIGRLKSLTSFEQAEFRELLLSRPALEAASRYPPSRVGISVSGDALISGDGDLLVQAFVNLIDNSAEEAERAGKAPASIAIRMGVEDGRSYALFSDDNTGLSPETAARLGRERFTTKRTGSGLGLLFVGRTAAIHGGTFRVEAGPAGNFMARLEFGPGKEALP